MHFPTSLSLRLGGCCAAGLGFVLGCADEPTAPTASDNSLTLEAGALAQASDTWIARAPTPRALSGYAVGAAPNSAGDWFVHIFGGDNGTRSGFASQRYNVEANQWGGGTGAFIDATDLNGVGKLGNKLYFTGGAQCCGEDGRTFNTTWAYQPSTDRLFRKADLPRATTSGVSGVIDGKLYVLAGFCSGEPTDPGHCIVEGPVRQFYRYDPATNTWIRRQQPPHHHTGGAGAVINGKFYVVGDCCMEDERTFLDVYDPVTNTWTTKSNLPVEKYRLHNEQQFSAAVIQNRLFVLQAGISNESYVIRAFLYDPVTNDWRIRRTPPVFGEIVRVQVHGQARLFLPGSPSSYMYAP